MADDGKKPVFPLRSLRRERENRPEDGVAVHWRDWFVRLAYRFLWNWSDAEDAVHDALVTAEIKQEQVRDKNKWRQWVTKIVINQCHQVHRRRVRSKDIRQSLPEIQVETTDRQETKIEQKELADILKKLIAELPDRQRTAVVLRHLEGLEYEEIARIMGVSESSVRVHVYSGRESLRKMILARYPEWAGADL